MLNEIVDNLEFFSELTQKSLSAFHLTASDESYEDSKYLKNLISKNRKRVLVKIEIKGSNSYKRYFSDGFSDIVNYENIKSPSHVPLSEEAERINNILLIDYAPILTLKLGREIKENDWKDIESPIEKLFFI